MVAAFPSVPLVIGTGILTGGDWVLPFSARKRSRSRSNSAVAACEVDAEEVPVEIAAVGVGGTEAAVTDKGEKVARCNEPEAGGD